MINFFRSFFRNLLLTTAAMTFVLAAAAEAQTGQSFTLSADDLRDGKTIALDKNVVWKFRAGDEQAWAGRDFDDADWQTIAEPRLAPELLAVSGWRGRAWLRLKIRVDDALVGKPLVLLPRQSGASEIYFDGRRLAGFGKIGGEDNGGEIVEHNPNSLPVPLQFDNAGEHTIAVRFASEMFADLSDWKTRWLARGKVYPFFGLSIKDASDWRQTIDRYADATSSRFGFLFIGIVLALACLHFLLYLFYRDERANLFYSLYAGALGVFILSNNLASNFHASGGELTTLRLVSSAAFALVFTGLLAFAHVAFDRRLGAIFWAMAALWVLNTILSVVYLGSVGAFTVLPYILIGLTFTFSIFQMVSALTEKRPGARILLAGVSLLAFGMTINLLRQFNLSPIINELNVIGEFAIVLGLPVAVSIFLARNFARTNRDLKTQLAQVEQLSQEKIEQERREAELRAENERRAKELEEARQLQLSMLPKKLPQIEGLEIAAYMKPASEVGGDYYDFHVGSDGTLTVAVGDATGHGLKAGTIVTAAKGLFRAFADEPQITDIFRRSSRALKEMNLRGLFMAMTVLKIKDERVSMAAAGMPSVLIYRAASRTVEEVSIRAMPLGSVAGFVYRQQEFALADGDCVLMMSDGFPEMFNPEDEILGFEKAAEILPDIAGRPPQEIINRFVAAGEAWAGTRPPDDDVTFVVLKVNGRKIENGI